jgi:hypothetical protein
MPRLLTELAVEMNHAYFMVVRRHKLQNATLLRLQKGALLEATQ